MQDHFLYCISCFPSLQYLISEKEPFAINIFNWFPPHTHTHTPKEVAISIFLQAGGTGGCPELEAGGAESLVSQKKKRSFGLIYRSVREELTRSLERLICKSTRGRTLLSLSPPYIPHPHQLQQTARCSALLHLSHSSHPLWLMDHLMAPRCWSTGGEITRTSVSGLQVNLLFSQFKPEQTGPMKKKKKNTPYGANILKALW